MEVRDLPVNWPYNCLSMYMKASLVLIPFLWITYIHAQETYISDTVPQHFDTPFTADFYFEATLPKEGLAMWKESISRKELRRTQKLLRKIVPQLMEAYKAGSLKGYHPDSLTQPLALEEYRIREESFLYEVPKDAKNRYAEFMQVCQFSGNFPANVEAFRFEPQTLYLIWRDAHQVLPDELFLAFRMTDITALGSPLGRKKWQRWLRTLQVYYFPIRVDDYLPLNHDQAFQLKTFLEQ